jgi:hypothetical protein
VGHAFRRRIEQKVPFGNHALENPDGVDDRGDGDPGNSAFETCAQMVAVLVASGFELSAADQVSRERSLNVGLRVGAAAATQAQDYWWSVRIPCVRYSCQHPPPSRTLSSRLRAVTGQLTNVGGCMVSAQWVS